VWGRCARGREMERDALGLRTGRAGPGVAHAGRERKRGEGEGGGPREKRGRPKRKKGCRPGWVGWALFPLSSSFLFLFYTQTIQTKLFEFK
jgi:hypothetical protein